MRRGSGQRLQTSGSAGGPGGWVVSLGWSSVSGDVQSRRKGSVLAVLAKHWSSVYLFPCKKWGMIHAESSGFSLTGYKASLNLSLLFCKIGSYFLASQFSLVNATGCPVPTGDLGPGHLAVNGVPSVVMFGGDFVR